MLTLVSLICIRSGSAKSITGGASQLELKRQVGRLGLRFHMDAQIVADPVVATEDHVVAVLVAHPDQLDVVELPSEVRPEGLLAAGTAGISPSIVS